MSLGQSRGQLMVQMAKNTAEINRNIPSEMEHTVESHPEIEIYTEDSVYIGSLEEDMPHELTDLTPVKMTNFENTIDNNNYCPDNIIDDNVRVHSDTQFFKIRENCTITNNTATTSNMYNRKELYSPVNPPGLEHSEEEETEPTDPDYDPENQSDRENEMDSESDIADTQSVPSEEDVSSTHGVSEAPTAIIIDVQEATHVTKSGNPRKRKKYVLSVKERKAIKLRTLQENHSVLPPCDIGKCRYKCTLKINEVRRSSINNQFWKLNWQERRHFIFENASSQFAKKHSVATPTRNNSFKYFLKDDDRNVHRVCKPFFLTTLGYKKTNDWVVHSVLKNTQRDKIAPEKDKRGCQPSVNKIDRQSIMEHVESYHPSVSHYRREHAPLMRYLPSDVTIKQMHQDYILKSKIQCSYDLYRKVTVNDMKISFTKLGHEECETCEEFALHDGNHNKENIDDQCNKCQLWSKHISRAKAARQMYRADAESHYDNKVICVSADLQKIIMLPRIDTFKRVVFIKRLVAYHESFVPVGEKKSEAVPYAVVWHEAIAGRCKEEITSTFFAFLMRTRDAENVIIWLDNCSAQNKNWGLFSFLIYMMNSGNISARTLTLKYFEAGHTFMSADHFHHQVELSLKRQGKTYDFPDFVDAIKAANSGKVEVMTMKYTDFYDWMDCSSIYKINHIKPRPYLSDMVEVIAEKGKFTLQYRCSFENEELKELDFLNKKTIKNGMSMPKQKNGPCGVPLERREEILQKLGGILPENRKVFWKELPISDGTTDQ